MRSEKFRDKSVDTYFIDENPQLFELEPSQNRFVPVERVVPTLFFFLLSNMIAFELCFCCSGQKLLHYLSEVMVNGPKTPLATDLKPATITPTLPEVDYSNFQSCPQVSII